MHEFSHAEMVTRFASMRAEMVSASLQALLITDAANIRYVTGFRGEPGTLLLTAGEAVLYTSFRSEPWAIAQTETLAGHLEISTTANPLDDVRKRLPSSAGTLGVDHSITHRDFLARQQFFSTHELQTSDVIEQVRRCKSPAEQQLLRRSQEFNEEVFNSILPDIRPGMTERAVQGLIISAIAQHDEIDGPSFTPIVAAGATAWEIHHQPDQTIIEQDQMLLIDLGVRYCGYASDMTRSVCLGRASAAARQVHQEVVHAQQSAIGAMQPGVTSHEIDAVARGIITEAGHARGFTHGLGHSIGLETHDPGLVLSTNAPPVALQEGMVFTVEPGIYIENGFGVRIEDVVIVTADGTTNITQQPHDLIELSL